MHVNVREAESQLSRLLELVEEGETGIITRDGKPFPFGMARNEPLVPEGDEWWQPMSSDAEADDWIEGR